MNWIIGMQKAIDYIEEHLTEEIDYDEVAKESFSSSFHFQRVFSILVGVTVGEYIRNRRVSLAGAELAAEGSRVIDVALKYGYESPDSFAKAFQKFHGILPSAARTGGTLRSFSRLSLKISLEGGTSMNYRIEDKPAMTLTGYRRRFSGDAADRQEQVSDFYITTRANQYLLQGYSGDIATSYNVLTDFADDGYDFYIAVRLDPWCLEHIEEELGEDAKRFENIEIPPQRYLVCETERSDHPTQEVPELRKQAVSQWLPSSGYELSDAPEIAVHHWFYEHENETVNHSRYIELWLPLKKAD
ncbi:MAG: AraC family transcriptional regulator [Clostridia bacterium]|nr:AraC family transcriptional regulator [Clostridia bacterium]